MLARRALRTKQHPQRSAALGGELQATQVARLRVPAPAQCRITGPGTQDLLESPQGTRSTDDRHALEDDALGNQSRSKRHQRGRHPHAPAGAGCACESGERGQQQLQFATAEAGDENLRQT